MAVAEHGTRVPPAVSAGALGLLTDCVGALPGQRLLLVTEPAGAGYHDPDASAATAAAARSLGMTVYQTEAPDGLGDAEAIERFVETLHGFDHVVLFARAGDQIRFTRDPRLPSMTMCYALARERLDSPFGTACHAGLCEVRALIDDAMLGARDVRVTCPRGSDYAGRPVTGGGGARVAQAEGVKRFPMLVPRPVATTGFAGRVVLSRFLTGTGSHYYEPYCLTLAADVVAVIAGPRLVRFEGERDEVERINAHYEDIAERYEVDPWHVHSWHAGIHPACDFPDSALNDMLRWSGSAFGNPRLLHFHTCGDYAPGEISWTVLDPTIRIDGIAVWERGVLHPERLPGGEAVLARHPRLGAYYASPLRHVGLVD